MTPCMGGWCGKRDKCPHYQADSDEQPRERMCIPGRDGWQTVNADPFVTREAFIFNPDREVTQ